MNGEGWTVMRMHRTQGETVLAACDEELIGKKLLIAKREYEVLASFYGTTRVGEEELVASIRASTIANLLGARTVERVVRAGLIEKDAIGLFDGVPHAEIVAL